MLSGAAFRRSAPRSPDRPCYRSVQRTYRNPTELENKNFALSKN
ncbi:hypothetical protein XCCB100_3499 [Xanthomonas campestris pv. campestris]|uniref:Uncharacterized protein n=1 Tax=Xanthomonas campestris pv. campestris (strain B100) TaxID=509169 RepID=B0RUC2_XANCB|nr:hypothetical protein XCCB100_3499 [Xanthomonas campestris pv. campestris]